MGYPDDDVFPVDLSTGDDTADAGAPGSITAALQDAASQPPPQSTALSWFLTPDEIATIPGLPDYAYTGNGSPSSYTNPQGAGDQVKNPTSYFSNSGPVSLVPYTRNTSGLDLSQSSRETGGKLDQAATSAGIVGHVIDGWNTLNHGVGLFLGQEAPDLLEKYSGPVGMLASVIEHGLDAYAQTSKGAPKFATWTDAGAKTASTLGGMGAGFIAGAEVGAPLGVSEFTGPLGGVAGALAPDWMLRNTSNQQLGGAIDSMFLDKQNHAPRGR